jgi:hypothetical protein
MLLTMKRRHQGRTRGVSVILPLLLLLTGLCYPSRADVNKNPYEVISDRNPFGLKPPPPPIVEAPAPPLTPPTPPATVEVTGITSILDNKRVLLEIVPGPGKPMIKPILKEGERVESIEVVSINVEKNEVVIKNGNLVTNLTFKVAKATPAVAVPGPPVVPGFVPPPHPIPQPATTFNNNNTGSGRNNVMVAGGAPTAPATPNAASAAFGGTQQGYGGAPAVGGAGDNSGFRSIPSRNIRSTAPQPEIPRDQQHLLIELNRVANEGNPRAAPLPPTIFNPSPQVPNPGGDR